MYQKIAGAYPAVLVTVKASIEVTDVCWVVACWPLGCMGLCIHRSRFRCRHQQDPLQTLRIRGVLEIVWKMTGCLMLN